MHIRLGAGFVLAVAGAALIAGSAPVAAGDRNGWDYPYFPERLMPEDGAPIQSDGKLTGTANDDSIIGSAMGRAPLYQAEDWYLMGQGDGYVTWFDGGDERVWGGDAGLILRGAFDANNAWGVNAFIDFGSEGAFAGQGSVGVEYEHVSDGGMSLRAGGNIYVPFREYAADEDFLRAPRLGGDVYAGIGQDIRWHRLELFVSGFHYLETDEVEDLSGVLVQGEYRYSGLDFLPDGSHLYVAAGVGWDSLDQDLNPQVSVGIAFPFGNDGSKDRVAEIKRNIGFGTAFVPLERKVKKTSGGTDLGCGPGAPAFESSAFFAVILQDNQGSRVVNSGTVGDLIPASEIQNACQGFSQCVDAISSIGPPIPMNFGNNAFYNKQANTCEFTSGIGGGE